VEETIVEVSLKNAPDGQRFIPKPYPKTNEPRTFGVRQPWLDQVAHHIHQRGIGPDDLLFATAAGTPIARNTFRTRIWLPAVKAPASGSTSTSTTSATLTPPGSSPAGSPT
jgi:hypothetical protein